MEFRYFKNVQFDTPIEDIKKQFHKLSLQLHPDCGGSEADFVAMAAEYDELLKHHQEFHRASDGTTYTREPENPEQPGEFAAVIDALLRMDGIEFELIGVWLWVFGDTKPHKDELKDLGLRWNAKRGKWYKAPNDSKRRPSRMSKASYEELREKYGTSGHAYGHGAGRITAA